MHIYVNLFIIKTFSGIVEYSFNAVPLEHMKSSIFWRCWQFWHVLFPLLYMNGCSNFLCWFVSYLISSFIFLFDKSMKCRMMILFHGEKGRNISLFWVTLENPYIRGVYMLHNLVSLGHRVKSFILQHSVVLDLDILN